jgi:hypothetical protein
MLGAQCFMPYEQSVQYSYNMTALPSYPWIVCEKELRNQRVFRNYLEDYEAGYPSDSIQLLSECMEDYRVSDTLHQGLDQGHLLLNFDLPYLLEDYIEVHYSLHDFPDD